MSKKLTQTTNPLSWDKRIHFLKKSWGQFSWLQTRVCIHKTHFPLVVANVEFLDFSTNIPFSLIFFSLSKHSNKWFYLCCSSYWFLFCITIVLSNSKFETLHWVIQKIWVLSCGSKWGQNYFFSFLLQEILCLIAWWHFGCWLKSLYKKWGHDCLLVVFHSSLIVKSESSLRLG